MVQAWFAALLAAPFVTLTPEVPKVGADVPPFRMADQDGRLISAASLQGKRYLLAFYPKDFTPG